MHTHIGVNLGGESQYSYMNHLEDVGLGDFVVVQLPSGRFTMGQVVSVDLTPEGRTRATKWIVDKVTFDTEKWEMLTALKPPPEPKKKKKGYTWYTGIGVATK